MSWAKEQFDFRTYEFLDGIPFGVQNLRLVAEGGEERPSPTPMIEVVEKDIGVPIHALLAGEDAQAWKSVGLTISALRDQEGSANPKSRLFVQAICEPTRKELAYPLSRGGHLLLELPIADLRDRVDIRLLEVTSTPDMPGLVTGKSNVLSLVIDPPKVSGVGAGMRVEWSKDVFQRAPRALSTIEWGDSGPVMYLNEGLSDFRAFMSSKRSGIYGRLRGYLLTQLEVDGWLALGQLAVDRLKNSGSGLDLDELEEDDDITARPGLDRHVIPILLQLHKLSGEPSSREMLVQTVRLIADPGRYEQLRVNVQSEARKGAGLGGDLERLLAHTSSSGSSAAKVEQR